MILAARELHTFYGKSHILHGVSIDVGAGEVVGVLGRNGVGKSTTLKTIMGLLRPAGGSNRTKLYSNRYFCIYRVDGPAR